MHSQGGFVVPADVMRAFLVSPQFAAAPETRARPFAHEAAEIPSLEGWFDRQTRAAFHDFTLYSPAMDTFLAVRLTVEQGVGHGSVEAVSAMRVVRIRGAGDLQPAEYAVSASRIDPSIACAVT